MTADNRRLDLAEDLVRQYGTRDPFRIARQKGIQIYYMNTSHQKGFSRIILKQSCIFINENMSEPMQKMTCAHELGHLLLHRDLLQENGIMLEYELFDIHNKTEFEANVFAANLLIDEKELREMAGAEMDMVEIAAAMDINVNLLMIKLILMQKKGINIPVPFTPDRKFLGTIRDQADAM